MYVLEDKAIAFIAHPKTASTSTAAALLTLGFQRVGKHHEVLPIEEGWSVISTIRDPLDVVVSWYFHYAKHSQAMPPFNVWLRRFLRRPPPHVKDRLFFGLPQTTHVMDYRTLQDDFDWVLREFRLPRIELPVKNVGNVNKVPRAELYTDSDLTTKAVERYEQDIQDYGALCM